MEQGDAFGSNRYHQIWSNLDEKIVDVEGPDMESLEDDFKSLLIVPSNSKHSDVELFSDEVEIHSDVEVSSFENQGWCKITRNSDFCYASVQNKSLNVNFADETDVPNEDTNISQTVSDGCLSYGFKMMPMNESSNKVFKISLDSEHVKCGICLNIWLDVVTLAPCFHNFCHGCFSKWLRRSQENLESVLCPHCLSDVEFVGRNHFLHKIEVAMWQSNDEELATVNSHAIIKPHPVINFPKKPRSKRPRKRIMPEEDIYHTECIQCGTEYGGFQCNKNTVHLQCYACEGMMPFRTNIRVPQKCVGCGGAFCGVYLQSQLITNGDAYQACTLKPIGEHSITRIPLVAHERNRHEQDITGRCIQQMGKTLQDVVSEWVTKFNNREIDRTGMPLNNVEMINSGTHICSGCYDKLVSFLLYLFRTSLPKYHLPEDAAGREDCWYGYMCRTQHHNRDHARKLNHVCPPTKGSIGS